jgi:acyl-CoA synthetase (NDP forming)
MEKSMPNKNTERREKNIAAMLNAKSVAIVGISGPDRFGGQVFANLKLLGYDGKIYGVNPKYETLYDQVIYPSLSDLPERPDCVILSVGNSRLVPVLKEAADLAVPSAVIFSNAHGEVDGIPIMDTLKQVAIDSGMVVCGPNGMGTISYHQKLPMTGYRILQKPAGNITFVSHSGSIWDAVRQNSRGINFNYAISSGNEMVTTVADYLMFALTDPTTKVIGMFLESVRDPDRFCKALSTASDKDIPVVALKVGRSQRAAQLAQAHTGALVGEDSTYDALFKYYGVQRVRSMDEMMDTLELFASGMRPHNSKMAAILDSGGERALLVDLAEDNTVEFAELSPKTLADLDEILEPGIKAENPLDAFGTNELWEAVFTSGMKILASDPEVGLTALCVDLYPRNVDPPTYESMTVAIKDEFKNPFVVLANVTATAADFKTSEFREAGIPVLMGTETGVRAIKHLFAHAEFQRKLRENNTHPALPRLNKLPSKEKVTEIRNLLKNTKTAIDEVESKQILSEYGIRVSRERIVNSLAQALLEADEIGYPVVLKTAAGTAHKTEVRGIHLNLSNREELTSAYQDLESRLGTRVVVQEMVPEGVELLLGVIDDSQFGSLLMVGIGGILVEVMKDTQLIWLPTDAEKVKEAFRSLKFAEILKGVRGQEKSNLDAIVETTLRLGHFAQDCGDLIAELDINPLIAGWKEAVVVDALIIPKEE